MTVGWNNRIAGADTTRHGPPAAYTIDLPFSLPGEWRLDESSALQFLLVPTEAMPGPRSDPEPAARDSSAAPVQPENADRPDDDEADENEKPPVDLSVEMVDALGNRASLPLSRYGVIRRPLEAWILRRRDIEEDRFGALSETVLQTYTLPFADFVAANPALDPLQLTQVRFVFDRAVSGTVLIDDIGFASPDPAFSAGGR